MDYYLPIFQIIYQEPNTYLIFVIHYEHSKNNEESKPFVFFRDKNKENESKFRDSLRNIDWQNIYNENDANITYNSFLNKYFDIYNSCFPLKKWKHRSMHLKDRRYISAGLQKSIKLAP